MRVVGKLPSVLLALILLSAWSPDFLSIAATVHPDIVDVLELAPSDVVPGGLSWADSYSVGNKCYCMSTFDHGIGTFQTKTPLGWKTVEEVCALLGPGPGHEGHPVYNDVQCGNGPPNDAGDEHTCPGRTDMGVEGCGHVGPEWNFESFLRAEHKYPARRSDCSEISPRDRRPSRPDRLSGLRTMDP